MSQQFGSIFKVFIKPDSRLPMVEPANGQLNLIRGYGIEGDANSDAFSPRQVLITRYEELDDFKIRPGDLRENIVLKNMPASSFVPGALIRIGESVQIRLTLHCEPCKRIGHLVRSLKEIEGKRGILGVVLADGEAKIEDPVFITPNVFSPLSPVPYQRFLAFISQIPCGKVVTYKQVVKGMGVAESYIRAMPRYIQKTSPSTYPVHRIVDTEGSLLIDYIPGQKEMLSDEKVTVVHERDLFNTDDKYHVDVDKHGWTNSNLYLADIG